MKKFALIAAAVVVAAPAFAAINPDIMVIEALNTSTTVPSGQDFSPDEYIEFLLTVDMTAAQLAGYRFGDSTGATASKFTSFGFNQTGLASIASVFPAGTIITVGGSSFTADLAYSPVFNVNPTNDGAWNLLLKANDTAYITDYDVSGDDFALAGTGDVLWIDTVDTGLTAVHAIGYDSAPGAFLTSGGNVVNLGNLTISGGDAISFNGGAGDALSAASYSEGPTTTLGLPNGGVNTNYIHNELRSGTVIPEPSSLSLLALAGLGLRRRRA